MALLNYGLQHSIEKPLKAYWINLIMETEQAIKLLDVKIQNPYRNLAAKKLKQIHISNGQYNATQTRHVYIIKKLNHILVTENEIMVPADKVKTTVIIYSDDYTNKVYAILTENKFHTLQQNPNEKCQKLLLKTLQQNYLIINKRQIKHLMQKNPKSPTLKV
jgi:hypothetical protein